MKVGNILTEVLHNILIAWLISSTVGMAGRGRAGYPRFYATVGRATRVLLNTFSGTQLSIVVFFFC